MNPTLTVSQLVVLGLAMVAGSFALNAWFIRHEFARFETRVDSLAKLLEAPDGLLVRTGQLETRVDSLDVRVSLPRS